MSHHLSTAYQYSHLPLSKVTTDKSTAKTVDSNKDNDNDNENENEDENADLDMSRENSRTFKIFLLDVAVSISSSVIYFGTGYVIEYAGFFYTMLLVVGIKLALFLFAFAFVAETGKQKKSVGFIAPLRWAVVSDIFFF